METRSVGPRLTLTLPRDLRDELLKLANVSDRSAAAEARIALHRHLAEHRTAA